MSKASKHVVPNGAGGWAVRNFGALRSSRTFRTQQQAIIFARDAARKNGTELYVHGRDWMIKDKRSYGSDSSASQPKK